MREREGEGEGEREKGREREREGGRKDVENQENKRNTREMGAAS